MVSQVAALKSSGAAGVKGQAAAGGAGGPAGTQADYIRQQKEFLTQLQMAGPTGMTLASTWCALGCLVNGLARQVRSPPSHCPRPLFLPADPFGISALGMPVSAGAGSPIGGQGLGVGGVDPMVAAAYMPPGSAMHSPSKLRAAGLQGGLPPGAVIGSFPGFGMGMPASPTPRMFDTNGSMGSMGQGGPMNGVPGDAALQQAAAGAVAAASGGAGQRGAAGQLDPRLLGMMMQGLDQVGVSL